MGIFSFALSNVNIFGEAKDKKKNWNDKEISGKTHEKGAKVPPLTYSIGFVSYAKCLEEQQGQRICVFL